MDTYLEKIKSSWRFYYYYCYNDVFFYSYSLELCSMSYRYGLTSCIRYTRCIYFRREMGDLVWNLASIKSLQRE